MFSYGFSKIIQFMLNISAPNLQMRIQLTMAYLLTPLGTGSLYYKYTKTDPKIPNISQCASGYANEDCVEMENRNSPRIHSSTLYRQLWNIFTTFSQEMSSKLRVNIEGSEGEGKSQVLITMIEYTKTQMSKFG